MKESAVKNVRIWAVVALLIVSCFALLACQSEEDALRAKADSDLAEVKNINDESLSQMVDEMGVDSTLEMFQIDSKELLKSWLEGFDYSVDDVKVDGDTATVTATLHYKSLEEAMTNWQTEFTTLLTDESVANMTEDELYKAAGVMLMDCINEASMTSSTVDIPYEKVSGTWDASSDAESVLSEAFAGSLA
ncbi:MAG: hypothetical protein ACOYD7_00885 [Raoultibacter sp.]